MATTKTKKIKQEMIGIKPLMQDGTYLSRNFATLGPLTLETPCVTNRKDIRS